MVKKETRRHHRIPYLGRVRVSWEAQGYPKQALGRCLDISDNGLRIEIPEPIPPYTNVQLQADQIKLWGPATVRYVAREGSKYILGLELSQAMRDQALSAIREPWTARRPISVT